MYCKVSIILVSMVVTAAYPRSQFNSVTNERKVLEDSFHSAASDFNKELGTLDSASQSKSWNAPDVTKIEAQKELTNIKSIPANPLEIKNIPPIHPDMPPLNPVPLTSSNVPKNPFTNPEMPSRGFPNAPTLDNPSLSNLPANVNNMPVSSLPIPTNYPSPVPNDFSKILDDISPLKVTVPPVPVPPFPTPFTPDLNAGNPQVISSIPPILPGLPGASPPPTYGPNSIPNWLLIPSTVLTSIPVSSTIPTSIAFPTQFSGSIFNSPIGNWPAQVTYGPGPLPDLPTPRPVFLDIFKASTAGPITTVSSISTSEDSSTTLKANSQPIESTPLTSTSKTPLEYIYDRITSFFSFFG